MLSAGPTSETRRLASEKPVDAQTGVERIASVVAAETGEVSSLDGDRTRGGYDGSR